MSFSLHSSTENFGGGRRSASVGSNSSSRLNCPVKSSIGLMSLKASARPLSRNHWNESRWIAIRSGRGRASLMFANETRSGLRDREDNGQLLPGEKAAAEGGTAGTAGRGGRRDRTDCGSTGQVCRGARRDRGITESST